MTFVRGGEPKVSSLERMPVADTSGSAFDSGRVPDQDLWRSGFFRRTTP
jgi:hypothetical protein